MKNFQESVDKSKMSKMVSWKIFGRRNEGRGGSSQLPRLTLLLSFVNLPSTSNITKYRNGPVIISSLGPFLQSYGTRNPGILDGNTHILIKLPCRTFMSDPVCCLQSTKNLDLQVIQRLIMVRLLRACILRGFRFYVTTPSFCMLSQVWFVPYHLRSVFVGHFDNNL